MQLYQPTITGSLLVSGSVNISGSLTMIGGTLSGTASIASTASSADNFIVRNTLTATTLVVQTITSSVSTITGSTNFGSLLANTHSFTGSVSMTGSLNVGSNINLNNNSGILYWNNTGGGTLYGYIQGSPGLMNLQASASGDINFGNGVDLVRIKGSGNVGIGTNSPLGSSTERTLHLSDGGAGFTTLYVTNGANTVRGIFAVASSLGTVSVGTQTNHDFRIVTNDTVRMFVSSSGNIGIGTTNPATYFTRTLTIDGSSSQGIMFRASGTDRGYVYQDGSFIQLGSNAGGVVFKSSDTERMRIASGGNIGINNTSPNGKLHIGSDDTPSISGTSPTGAIIIQSTATTALTMGVFASSPFYGWMQMRHGALADIPYGLAIQPLGGNVGIGTTSINHRLDVNGNINIPGGNQLVFNNEASVWCILARTSTSTANLGSALKNMIYCGGGANEGFAVLGAGYAAAFEVNNSGNAWVRGTLTKGGGSFRIDHPLPEKKDTHYLYHSFIEGPKADLIYRGKIHLVNGTATVNIDEASTMTEGTFELLTRDAQCFVNNLSGWDLVKGNITGNILTITSQNTESTDEISWMVVAERNDDWFRASEMTDDNGNTIVEKLKPVITE